MLRIPTYWTALLMLALLQQAACSAAFEDRRPRSRTAPATTTPAVTAPVNERLGSAGQSYADPEFLPSENLVVFQDGADQSAWLGKLNPETGRFVSRTGKDYLVDANIAPMYRSFNGPEFGQDASGWSIYYTKQAGDGKLQIWRASPSFKNNSLSFETRVLTQGLAHQTAIAQINPNAASTQVFAIAGSWRGGDAVWFDANTPEKTKTFIAKRPSGTNAEFIPDAARFVTSIPDKSGVRQLAVINRGDGKKQMLTNGALDLSSAWAWRAPEYGGAPAVLALENKTAIGIWVEEQQGGWKKLKSLPLPAASRRKQIRSPEAFAFAGASYVVFGAHDETRHGDGEIWVYSLDGVAERCDTGEDGVFRLEPEPYVTGNKAYVYYSVRPDKTNWELWRCEPRIVTAGSRPRPQPEVAAPAPAVITASSTAGAYDIAAKSLTLEDRQRNKQLPVRVTYPVSGSALPIIMFSHGAWSSKDLYQPLARAWARHGYVVIQPTHEDSAVYGYRRGSQQAFKLWDSRPKDISLALNSLDEIESRIPELRGRTNRQRIGMAGHSFGGQTAQLIAGAKVSRLAARTAGKLQDDRITAVLLLSPSGSNRIIGKDAWSQMQLPMMTITGTRDNSRRAGQDHIWRMEPYKFAPAGDKYLMVIDGADHGLGGVTDEEDDYDWVKNRGMVELLLGVTVNFWDAYLRGDRARLDAVFSSSQAQAAGAKAALSTR